MHANIGVKESDTGLAPPNLWDLPADKQRMQEEQPLQVISVEVNYYFSLSCRFILNIRCVKSSYNISRLLVAQRLSKPETGKTQSISSMCGRSPNMWLLWVSGWRQRISRKACVSGKFYLIFSQCIRSTQISVIDNLSKSYRILVSTAINTKSRFHCHLELTLLSP
jgi:hypothetical protein